MLLNLVLLTTLLFASLSYGISSFLQQQNSPISVVQHYYDNLDFCRYSLDRPTLQILSDRLVRVHSNYSVIAELIYIEQPVEPEGKDFYYGQVPYLGHLDSTFLMGRLSIFSSLMLEGNHKN